MSQDQPGGKIIYGLGLGCATQIVLFLLGVAVVSASNNSKLQIFSLLGWALTQWIILVPIILHQRARGQRRTIQGILIAGGLGVLLGSACASILLSLR